MKRIISLVVAVVLALGMLPMAALAADSYVLGMSGSMDAATVDLGTIAPKTTVRLDLEKDGGPITRTDVRNEKLDVKIKASKGSNVISNVAIAYDGDNAYVKVEFVELYPSTKETDFELQAYLTKNKSRLSGTNITLFGTMENEIQYVDADTGYVDVLYTPLLEATEFVRSVEVYLGYDVSIYARMNSGKRYYAYITKTPGSTEEQYINKYGFDDFYSLTTINMNGASNRTKIDIGGTYYVYNSGLEYIGTTKEELPYSTRYYLASAQIDIDPDDVTEGQGPIDDDLEDLNGGDGPDADSNGNVGSTGERNPYTGVSNYANVAIVTGILALAAAGAVAFKKK